jgi:tRNA pseudouridine38-40 synthase
MRNIQLTLEYDGTDFHGWQQQPGLRTVQGALDEAIERLTGVRSNTTASGRTDAGVHALGQVVHFLTASRLEPAVIARALNAMLPGDVRVTAARERPQAFHATLDAVAKRYRYTFDNRAVARPFLRRQAWHVARPLDAAAMGRAAAALVGRHDFRSFETEWPNRASSVRTVAAVDVAREGDSVTVEAEADGFLYNMVRAIAGTLMLVGLGRRSEAWPGEVLAAEDRRAAGPTAPPQGLCLLWVRYRGDG